MRPQQSNFTTHQTASPRRWSFLAHLRRLRRDESASTAIEFAIVAMPFLILMLVIIELGLAFFAGQVLDNAVADSARLIRTGQAIEANLDQAGFKQKILDKLPGFFAEERLSVDVKSYSSFADVTIPPSIDDDGNLDDDLDFNPGGASQIVVVRVFYRWPMAGSYLGIDFADLADGSRLLGSTAAFRNEPFPF